MLKHLRIQNFVLIDSLELDLRPGLNILTGETGAGKSIILDALSMVLGEKADPSLIREGTSRAAIEAAFDTRSCPPELLALLQREDLLPDEDPGELTLTRELRAEGRSTARVNGHTTALGILQEIGAFLVDIHGQTQHLTLLRPATHIHLVDQFAGNAEILAAYRTHYQQFLSLRKELKDLRQGEAEALRNRDLLTWQINEIKEAALSPREEETLLKERERLANAEKIARHLREALRAIDGKNDEQPGILEQSQDLGTALEALADYDEEIRPLADDAIRITDSISQIHDKLRQARSRLGYSSRRRDQIEERLIQYAALKRKYGQTTEAVLAFQKQAESRLSLIDGAAEQIPQLEKECEELQDTLTGLARQLTQSREAASKRISAEVEQHLSDLRMSNARFTVDIQPLPAEAGDAISFSSSGADTLQFFLAPNPGQSPAPLAKIASGGETSRIMLALKAALAHADPVPTLIFDEIDQGIGGRIGALVGQKLSRLSLTHQVICITHLPQLAAFADAYYSVRKTTDGGKTRTNVIPLSPEQSVSELASLLGADNPENQNAVRAMLRDVQTFKQQNPNERMNP